MQIILVDDEPELTAPLSCVKHLQFSNIYRQEFRIKYRKSIGIIFLPHQYLPIINIFSRN